MLKVKFTIVELVVISPQWAYVRTNSAGTQKVNATGATSAEANQELFIFKKSDDGRWQIARYAFPPPIRGKAVDGDGRLGGRLPAI